MGVAQLFDIRGQETPHDPTDAPLTFRFAAALAALLTSLTFALPVAAQVTCTITADELWSEDDDAALSGDTLMVEEGAYWEFNLIYSCTGITDTTAYQPWISITRS